MGEEERPAKKVKLSFAEQPPQAVRSLWNRIKQREFAAAPVEEEVGITEYVDPARPAIHGILKHRYIDFLVHEVDLAGNVVKLTELDKPQGEPLTPIQNAAESEAAAGTFDSEDSQFLIAKLGSEKWTALVDLYKAGRPSKKERQEWSKEQAAAQGVESNPVTEKQDRVKFHQAVRQVFGGDLATETRDSSISPGQQAIQILWADGRAKARSAAATRCDHPPFVHFTLHKTNKETQDCLMRISRLLKLNIRDLGTAGTKDKRGITTQRVSLNTKRLRAPQRNSENHPLKDVWSMLTGPQARPSNRMKKQHPQKQGELLGIRVGNFEFAQNALELGQLAGNVFTVTIRDVSPDVLGSVDHIADVVRTKGFINYYGMQRFGTSIVPTHAIGLCLVKSDWETAVELLLGIRPGEQMEAVEARNIWANRKDAFEALKKMPRHCVAERSLLEAFAGDQKRGEPFNYLSALSKIPKNLKMMYVHGYQSYLWNTVLSARIRRHGCDKPVVGDFVYADAKAEEEVVETDELDAPVDQAPAEMDVDPSIQEPLSKVEQLRLTSKVPATKKLTQEDIDSGKYSIFDVVFPLPGFVVGYPDGELGALYRAMMEADGLDPDDLHRNQPEYSMAGTYRKIMHLPAKMDHSVLRYDDPNQPLAFTDEDIVLCRSLPPTNPEGQHIALQFELQLGTSSYATMALRELLKAPTNALAQKVLTESRDARHQQQQSVQPDNEIAPSTPVAASTA